MGKGPESITGKHYPSLFPDSGTSELIENLKKVLSEGESRTLKKICIQKNGQSGNQEDQWFDFNLVPKYDHDKKITGVINFITEVTADVKNQKRIRENEIELKELTDNLSFALEVAKIGYYESDLVTQVVKSNKQFRTMHGFPADKEINRHEVYDSMLPEYREELKQLVSEAIEKHTPFTFEYEVAWPDGSKHWISLSGKAIYENEKPVSIIGITATITERKHMEQQKDDFLGLASHEFKTPLTSLRISLQLLEKIIKSDANKEKGPELVDQSLKSLNKLLILVDRMMNMNQANKEIELEKTEFTLAKLVEDCCNHVRAMGTYKIVLQGDVALKVVADSHRIDQVIINLVNNAVKYAPDSKEIQVKIVKIGDLAKLSVTDHGPGISPEKQAHLFDRYYQAGGKGLASNTGLGLGLYISAEIIKKHGGEMGVDSEPGKGSTFWFTIPVGMPN
ncbi:MAG TPA: ATP-binding protein [Sphingobacteriaceae bacterium]